MCSPPEIKSFCAGDPRSISNRVFVPYSLNVLVKSIVSSVIFPFLCCPGARHCHENGPGPEEWQKGYPNFKTYRGIFKKNYVKTCLCLCGLCVSEKFFSGKLGFSKDETLSISWTLRAVRCLGACAHPNKGWWI